MKVLCLPLRDSASAQYRITEPYSNIVSDIEFVFRDRLIESDIGDEDLRAVLIQRPLHPELPEFIKDLKKAGKIVVAEMDDDITTLPATNPYFDYYRDKIKNNIECMKLCDYIHVSTPELATNKKCTVFYNAINFKKYSEPQETIADIGWMGTFTHFDSLMLIKPTIEDALNKNLKVLLCSNKAWLEKIFKPHENLIIQDWVETPKAHLLYSKVKINLAPLTDTKFNRAKSELRLLESGAWGIPSISSAVAPYLRFNRLSEGANIIVKKDKPRYWIEAIEFLCDNDNWNRHSQKSLQAVKDHYDLSKVNSARAGWWTAVVG